jgi:hypothetical protein
MPKIVVPVLEAKGFLSLTAQLVEIAVGQRLALQQNPRRRLLPP